VPDVEDNGESVAKPPAVPFNWEVDCSVTTEAIPERSDCCGELIAELSKEGTTVAILERSDCCGELIAELSNEGTTVAILERSDCCGELIAELSKEGMTVAVGDPLVALLEAGVIAAWEDEEQIPESSFAGGWHVLTPGVVDCTPVQPGKQQIPEEGNAKVNRIHDGSAHFSAASIVSLQSRASIGKVSLVPQILG
jgi:hypothetical protein